MELYKLGGIFLDISIGIMVLGAVIRLILAMTYFKRNGARELTDEQRKSLRRKILPISIIGLVLAIVAFILLII